MKKLYSSLMITLLMTSCVSLTSPGKLVTVVKEENVLKKCDNLGEVIATPPYFGPNDAKNTMRNKTADLGGDSMFITKYYSIGNATALAYKCN